MNYQETITWLYGQLPTYQKIGGAAMKAKLTGVRKLLLELGNPEEQWSCIHVAGTNGKGSSSHMLASVLQEAGYKVGLYTSPHLKDFRERIRVNGSCIGEEEVVQFVARHSAYFEDAKPSFFEMTVGMAFWYFAAQEVDIAVVEVGLGGRLDSTNVLSPEVCLITNIGLDHQDMLGDTLAEIAMEKAGIIKDGVAVVVSEYQEAVADIFQSVAKEKNANLIFATEVDYKTDLLGDYQRRNIAGVVATLRALKRFEIGEEALKQGLGSVVANTGLQGRWQRLSIAPKTICDTAHNAEGLSVVMQQLEKVEKENLHLVFGVVKEKRLSPILALLPKEAVYYFCAPSIFRAMDARELQAQALEFGLEGRVFASVADAYQAAREAANEEDCIYIGGSTFVVAEIL
ncbi:MAG: bifunctional folylpolyglutamate synthase/dihydrofolate synthase [Flavobacteriaceae bacterium]|nr:bifunctional folylpolyglutamate synthase/dihydrofolate synthase [Flavobacteriaceae bacterium]